jgi:3-hydroxybutyryl-CoA dehydrogenase
MSIERLGVVGYGLMWSGIAEASARRSIGVKVVDLDRATVEHGRARISRSIKNAQSAGKLTESESEAEAALNRITLSSDLNSLADCQLVVEAVVESQPEKLAGSNRLTKLSSPMGSWPPEAPRLVKFSALA